MRNSCRNDVGLLPITFHTQQGSLYSLLLFRIKSIFLQVIHTNLSNKCMREWVFLHFWEPATRGKRWCIQLPHSAILRVLSRFHWWPWCQCFPIFLLLHTRQQQVYITSETHAYLALCLMIIFCFLTTLISNLQNIHARTPKEWEAFTPLLTAYPRIQTVGLVLVWDPYACGCPVPRC